MDLAILTPTYKRSKLLYRLYESLIKQTSYDFKWIIVNDGSPDDTDDVVKNIVKKEKRFPIQYILKENGGKGSATNVGFDSLTNEKFVLIIDDDEILYDIAIETVLAYIKKYDNTNCGGIDFQRDNLEGRRISNVSLDDDFFASFSERTNKKLVMDGYTGYFTKAIKDKRFPIYVGEKYIGPDILQCLVDKEYGLLWSNKSIGTTEYLEGGLSQQGRRLRIKNPIGMILHCYNYQEKSYRFKYRFKYSIMGYAYFYFSKLSFKDLNEKYNIDMKKFNVIAKPLGFALFKRWKRKFS